VIPSVADTSERYSVVIGRSKTLECQVVRSDPPPTYTWSKNGEPLTGDETGLAITAHGNLTIYSAALSDEGVLHYAVALAL